MKNNILAVLNKGLQLLEKEEILTDEEMRDVVSARMLLQYAESSLGDKIIPYVLGYEQGLAWGKWLKGVPGLNELTDEEWNTLPEQPEDSLYDLGFSDGYDIGIGLTESKEGKSLIDLR